MSIVKWPALALYVRAADADHMIAVFRDAGFGEPKRLPRLRDASYTHPWCNHL